MEIRNKTDQVKYVAVELIGNSTDDIKNIECGLFMGITKRKDTGGKISTFMVVALTDKMVKIFNIDDYGIVTIEIVENMTRFTSIFKSTASDQASAIATLDFIIAGMDVDGRLLKNDLNKELIDIETYSEYNYWVISEKSNLNSYGSGETSKTTTKTNFSKPKGKPPEKKPELFFIERKEPLVEKEALNLMYEAVTNLDPRAIEILVCDVDVQKENQVTVVENSEDIKTHDDNFYDSYRLY